MTDKHTEAENGIRLVRLCAHLKSIGFLHEDEEELLCECAAQLERGAQGEVDWRSISSSLWTELERFDRHGIKGKLNRDFYEWLIDKYTRKPEGAEIEGSGKCPNCMGGGILAGAAFPEPKRCPACQGTGEIEKPEPPQVPLADMDGPAPKMSKVGLADGGEPPEGAKPVCPESPCLKCEGNGFLKGTVEADGSHMGYDWTGTCGICGGTGEQQ